MNQIKRLDYKCTEVKTKDNCYLVGIGKKEFDIRVLGQMRGIADIHRVSDDYKLVSRKWKVERTHTNGVTYSQWHTTALCSPTRSVFLTGRNHHQNGFASISESSTGFPGYNSHIPRRTPPWPTVLRDAGWSTFWVGKNHNIPVDAVDDGRVEEGLAARPRLRPLLRLHRRRDEPVVSRPDRGQPLRRAALPARGRLPPLQGPRRQGDRVHPRLQAVRARQALVPVVLPRRQPRAAPRAAGVHRQVQGQVRRRLRGLPRVGPAAHDRARDPARGHRADADQPDDAEGTFSEGDSVRPWDTLSDEEKPLFSRMAEVYAAFSEYTDHQVGRIVDYLEESGQLDNTIVLYCADNGASGEGSPNGSVNENKFFNAWPDTIEDNLPMIDKLGTPETYNHYPTGWAVAFSTPYRMFKRYSYQGGVCDPLVIHWPAGMQGARRGPRPVPPLHRHRPDDPRLLRRRDARRGRRLRADAAARRLDALLVRRGRRADREGAPVLRDARHARRSGTRAGRW